ncbi:MAG: NAD-dependent DNA ligase LigA [Candidatus Omnitrophota bacterium]
MDLNTQNIFKEIEQSRERLRNADYRYYVLSDPEMSDKEYDDMLKKLQELENRYPQFITADSPTQRVAGGISGGFTTVRHPVKMLSLDNTYSIDELRDWEDKIKRLLKRNVNIDYMTELKVDGISCALTYEKGALTVAATRGDGEIGENITANIKTIKSVPLRLREDDYPDILEVRGEIYMDKKELQELNKERLKKGEPLFANPRNAASGSLKLLEPAIVARRNLKCFVHSFGVSKGYEFANHREFMEKTKLWGLRVNPCNRYCKDLSQVIMYCQQWQDKRDALEYEIDGVVIKVNEYTLRNSLGVTLKSPRWAVAYKFPAHQATTTIKRIEFSVGRTGIITPVAILTPITCAGVTISRSTLHNFDEIERLDVRVGDTVLIERAGEVIPKIVKVITSKRTGTEKKVKIPARCPVCKAEVAKTKEEDVCWYCINPDCPAQLTRSLLHFASRRAMDIEGMGESVVTALVGKGVVKSLVDIYKLTDRDLLALPLFAQKKAHNLLAAIDASKQCSLSRFLYGLGIKHVGEKAAMVLAEHFKCVERFFELTIQDLQEIHEIGPVIADSLVNFFSSGPAKKLITEFQRLGIQPKEKRAVIKKNAITGKTFVFTGEMEGLSRAQAQEAVEALGGKWISSISKNVDFVVVGKAAGSKYQKARALELPIIDEAGFRQLLKI